MRHAPPGGSQLLQSALWLCFASCRLALTPLCSLPFCPLSPRLTSPLAFPPCPPLPPPAAEDRALVDDMATEARRISSGGALLGPNEAEQTLITMSTLTEDGISAVKQLACDRLLSSRVEVKLKVGGAGGWVAGSGWVAGWLGGWVGGSVD